MKLFDKLLRWNELHAQLKAAEEAGIEIAKENGDLRVENAKLRNEVDNLLDFEHLTSVAVAYAGCDECGEYKQTMLRLFAENDKLRKMLSELYEDQCDDGDKWKYRDRMRELGVEVDE